MPNLAQFDPAMCASHVAQCCWPRDRQAGDNNGNCATPYDSDCEDKDYADTTDQCYNELGKAPNTKGNASNGLIGPNGEPLRPIPIDRFEGDKSFPIIDTAWKPAYWNPENRAACYAPEPVS